jgi:hypothetical protein
VSEIQGKQSANAAHMHVVEAVINFGKFPVMGDIFVDFDFALEVI